ncbi:hypothetical protein D9V29_10635 [Mycetocola manganoxydans]|uniref:DUF3137 domain-containing protein n=1 Tax=Mycetocola manganoxydans TaxID=699879 RepID=A0A3L6ZRM9_9MICO|nr:hypothetical protein [Mycetocola manganoxydans]RLP70241.1 hypothetical protein D9V29_10635 [Mycetocola manganoxydans]GHD49476.1 hypothetical protein GCM10008097_22360 [Mycetocola manganoxydans]
MSAPTLRPGLSFDPTPLTDPVETRLVQEHHGRLNAGRAQSAGHTFANVLLVVVALVGVVMFALFLVELSRLPGGVFIALGVFVVVAGAVALITVRVRRRVMRDREIRFRLDRFAAANGMTYQHRVESPDLPGMIFSLGADRVASDVLRTTASPSVEFGHHQYLERGGKNPIHRTWGYVAIELGTTLPHIVLDAVKNNSAIGSNLPTSFTTQQRLSLEGDFDRYFELYCPEGYERDALYLFSPDIMARFVDHAALFDVEIVDDMLFLYTGPAISTVNPAVWTLLFDTVAALQAKVDAWARWRDERLLNPAATPPDAAATGSAGASPAPIAGALASPAGVAVEGRRLRKRWRNAGIVVFAVAFGLLGYVLQTL